MVTGEGFVDLAFVKMLCMNLMAVHITKNKGVISCNKPVESQNKTTLKIEFSKPDLPFTRPAHKTNQNQAHKPRQKTICLKDSYLPSVLSDFIRIMEARSSFSSRKWSLTICEEHTTPCTVLSGSYAMILSSLRVAAHFIGDYLIAELSSTVLAFPGNNVLHTRSQHQLTTGK